MIEVSAPHFSLQDTLASGQTFRWKTINGWSYGFLDSSIVKIRQEGDRLLYESFPHAIEPEVLRRYFALDLDLDEILRTIDVDEQIHQAIARFRGLRVMRQDPWECLASFILASFNNIKRIEGMIERLCVRFGEPLALNGFRSFRFPSPETIARASERTLRELGLGFRAPYLNATARLVADGKLSLEQLRQVEYRATKLALLLCDGVGDKVADCVALFSLEKHEAFPVDLWIERAMRYYFRRHRMTPTRIHDFARRHFGPYAGYAQQYLYHSIRTLRVRRANGG